MPTKKKRAKRTSCTVYAVRCLRRLGRNNWLGDKSGMFNATFAEARLYPTRSGARSLAATCDKIVPCRVRPLPSAKRNRTRTR